ncbi:hypothetical protein SAMN04488130_101604 [Flavobacterium urumqiense]|uniref:Uncharacterized protein n=1 Tax=Flavobacterium urumqiense TaxID=935224 RepID=A0A1H5T834_9FLAO|nr:hypothetical protein SAMN04488130_101604 [Flavobacterium urumqiense]
MLIKCVFNVGTLLSNDFLVKIVKKLYLLYLYTNYIVETIKK